MSRIFWERRAVKDAVKTYLESNGWTGFLFKEGFGDPEKADVITPPQIIVDVADSSKIELEIGRVSGDRVYPRGVQFDIYAESEERINTIQEEIGDWLDQVVITIKDTNQQEVGTLICYSSEDIRLAAFPPIIQPEIMRWRGVVSALMIAHYPNSG